MDFTCPKCGGELQATTNDVRYWSFTTDPQGLAVAATFTGLGDTDSLVRIYCENDCEGVNRRYFERHRPSVLDALDAAITEAFRDEDPHSFRVP